MSGKICGRCGMRYDGRAWVDLASCGTMSSDEVRSVVIGWSASAVVDLRRCRSCGTVLARFVDRAS